MKLHTLSFLILLLLITSTVASLNIPTVQQYLKAYAHNDMQEQFGSQRLAPEQEEKIKAIAKQMGIEQPIIIRKMNHKALIQFGYYNAIAAFHLFFNFLPLVDTPYLFVSEGFFEDLSDAEQQFLIGHELTHIKEQHVRFFNFILFLVVVVAYFLCLYVLRKYIQRKMGGIRTARFQSMVTNGASLAVLLMCMLAINVTGATYKRHIEWVADCASLAQLQSHDGAIKLMDRWEKEYKVPASNPYWGLFADHPTCADRKKFCREHKETILLS